MRAAPPVTVDLRRCRRWTAMVAVLSGLAAATLSGWLALCLEAPTRVAGTAAAAACLMVVVSTLATAPTALGRLRWDGELWWWSVANGIAEERSGVLSVTLDLGGWMLLKFVPATRLHRWPRSAAVWLPVADADLGASGHALRAAVYSRALKSPHSSRRGPFIE